MDARAPLVTRIETLREIICDVCDIVLDRKCSLSEVFPILFRVKLDTKSELTDFINGPSLVRVLIMIVDLEGGMLFEVSGGLLGDEKWRG